MKLITSTNCNVLHIASVAAAVPTRRQWLLATKYHKEHKSHRSAIRDELIAACAHAVLKGYLITSTHVRNAVERSRSPMQFVIRVVENSGCHVRARKMLKINHTNPVQRGAHRSCHTLRHAPAEMNGHSGWAG